jgi:hypothetical protein
MAVEEAIDAALVNRVLDGRFKGALDFGDRGDLAQRCTGEKGRRGCARSCSSVRYSWRRPPVPGVSTAATPNRL